MISSTAVAPWYYWTKYIMFGINVFSIIGIILIILIMLSNEFKKKTNIILICLIVFLAVLLFLNNCTDIIYDGIINIFSDMYHKGLISSR